MIHTGRYITSLRTEIWQLGVPLVTATVFSYVSSTFVVFRVPSHVTWAPRPLLLIMQKNKHEIGRVPLAASSAGVLENLTLVVGCEAVNPTLKDIRVSFWP